MLFEFISLGLLGMVLWTILENLNRQHHPPGPFRFPVIGNLVQMALASSKPTLVNSELGKKYGDVMSLKIGTVESVVLTSYEAIKELFSKEDVAITRMCEGIWLDRQFRNKDIGLILTSANAWHETRRFVAKAMRDYGFGIKSSMEVMIVDELVDIVQDINVEIEENDGVFKCDSRLIKAGAFNLVYSMFAGTRFSHDDPKLIDQLNVAQEFSRSGLLGTGINVAFPQTRHIFAKLTGYSIQMASVKAMQEFSLNVLKEFKEMGMYRDNPQCFVDVFIAKMEEEANDPNSKYTENHFATLSMDLFIAGSDTTNNVVRAGILHIMLNPSIQRKLQDEIQQVADSGRPPVLADEQKMIYTQAIILEAERVTGVTPVLIPRIAPYDISLKGYQVKKGTAIFADMTSLWMDTKYWSDPQVFRPERFLSDDGLGLNKGHVERMSLYFGSGKRICFGETLARASLFLFITTLFTYFDFLPVPGQPLPDTEMEAGFTSGPKPFNCLLRKRP